MKNVLFIGSINQSPFVESDIKILSNYYNVSTVNIIGKLSKDKINNFFQYFDLAISTVFNIFPKIVKNDVVFIWFADVHAFLPLLLSKLLRKEIIISIGGYEVCDMPEINYGLQRYPLRGWISRIVMRYADICIVPSQSYFARSIPYVDADKLCILPTYIDIKFPKSVEKENIILMVGSGTEENYKLKGIPKFDEIANRVDARFCLIGAYDNHIKNKYKNIEFLRQLDHNSVMDWMNKSKIYCQLSYTESFGVSILEAMSVGCIPVILNIDNLKNLIDDDIVSLCSNDTNEIVEYIHKFLKIKTFDYKENIINKSRFKLLNIYNERKEGLKRIIGD